MYGREKNGRFKTGYEPTPAQRWQRKRYAAKGIVTSTWSLIRSLLNYHPYHNGSLTELERIDLEAAAKHLNCVRESWNSRNKESKMLFLKKELL